MSRTASLGDDKSLGAATKLRRHGSFLGLSAAKREKAAAMGGTGNSLLSAGRSSFVFSADDSCSNAPVEDTPGIGVSTHAQKKYSSRTVSTKGLNRPSKSDNIIRTGHQLFRSLSGPI